VITIPIVKVKDFRGRDIITAKLDDDLEVEYQLISCPDDSCGFTTTSLKDLRRHFQNHSDEVRKIEFRVTPATMEATTKTCILQILNELNDGSIKECRKNADSYNSMKVWEAVVEAKNEIILEHQQHDWLLELLKREVDGHTVAETLFGLSWYSITSTLSEIRLKKVNA